MRKNEVLDGYAAVQADLSPRFNQHCVLVAERIGRIIATAGGEPFFLRFAPAEPNTLINLCNLPGPDHRWLQHIVACAAEGREITVYDAFATAPLPLREYHATAYTQPVIWNEYTGLQIPANVVTTNEPWELQAQP